MGCELSDFYGGCVVFRSAIRTCVYILSHQRSKYDAMTMRNPYSNLILTRYSSRRETVPNRHTHHLATGCLGNTFTIHEKTL